jgi:predicted nucleic acid-binding protein
MHGLGEESIYDFVGWVGDAATVVPLDPLTRAPIRDQNDIVVIQTALSGQADVLCTLDRDFFEPPASTFLASCSIAVITDAQLIQRLRR